MIRSDGVKAVPSLWDSRSLHRCFRTLDRLTADREQFDPFSFLRAFDPKTHRRHFGTIGSILVFEALMVTHGKDRPVFKHAGVRVICQRIKDEPSVGRWLDPGFSAVTGVQNLAIATRPPAGHDHVHTTRCCNMVTLFEDLTSTLVQFAWRAPGFRTYDMGALGRVKCQIDQRGGFASRQGRRDWSRSSFAGPRHSARRRRRRTSFRRHHSKSSSSGMGLDHVVHGRRPSGGPLTL